MSFCSPILGKGATAGVASSGSSSSCTARCAFRRSSFTLVYTEQMPNSQAGLPSTIIVVPCYNEARRLDTRAFTEFRPIGRRVEFLFVNDGSRDETLSLLERLRSDSPETI